MAENKKGRKKQDFERIQKKKNRINAFCKRKLGLASKSDTLSTVFDCEIAFVCRTECLKWYFYCNATSQADGNNLLRYYLENRHLSKFITAEQIKTVRM